MPLSTEKSAVLASQAPRVRVFRELRQSILSGAVQAGDFLPSERQLSMRYGVGRNTLRAALELLDKEGLVQRYGTRLRAGRVERPNQTGWLKQAVAVLAVNASWVYSAPVWERWLRYATLGTMDAIREAGMHCVTLDAAKLTPGDLERLVADHPAGVLVPEVFHDTQQVAQTVRILTQGKVPVVLYGGAPEQARFDRVYSDHESGAYQVTNWAIQRGCRRIVQMRPKPWDRYWYSHRQAGYDRAMQQAGLESQPVSPLPVYPVKIENAEEFQHHVKTTAGYLLELLTGPQAADVLILATDREVAYVAAAARLFGRTPGKDLLIAGYDNYYDLCEEQTWEPTTPDVTVDKRNDEAGRQMVRLLLDRSAGKLPGGPQEIRVEPKLILPRGLSNENKSPVDGSTGTV